jgi:cytochrome oxidase Cu insertion factor (SCO1/SenC/PrrC family)
MSTPPHAVSPSPSLRASRPAILAAALIGAGALALVGTRLAGRGTAEPPRLGTLPDFGLVERSGRTVALADLHGSPWVADFIFTQCAGACPAMTARMARLRRELPAGVRSVSFTVDPGHDTPAALARYATGFGADGEWLFVTGPQKDLYDLSTAGFKLAAMEVPPAERQAGGDGPFLHSSKFVLVDGQGVVRGYYDSTDEQAVRALVSDARALKSTR